MNMITGSSGNDTLTGTSAADYLDGGAGADRMTGLGGDDVYIVDHPSDVVVEAAGDGTDRINSTISFTLDANIEDLWLVGAASVSGAGNTLDNVLWGNAGDNALQGLGGNDVIDGGAGADTLTGGTGNDTYWVDNPGDIVTENAGEGNDTVNSSLANYTLPANVENLTLIAGAGNINGTGNELDNNIAGNEGNNVLVGGAGNDALNGGAGADTMTGGTGNDTYWVDNPGDIVTENAGEGSDTVISSLANYTLSAHVENLTLGTTYSGTENLNGTGNELDNTLRGNCGNNTLIGGAGNDTLIGGNGNDTLTGGSGSDTFYISTSDTGTDTITDLSSGDVIEVCGAFFFSGSVSQGDGSSVHAGEVQLAASGGRTTLYVGTDGAAGADVTIVLDGMYDTGNFQLSGFDIRYDTNHAPVVTGPIADQQATENSAFTFHVPANTFSDADGDTLTYSAVLFDPDWGMLDLPSWLHFNAATGTFSGTSAHGDIGSSLIAVIATDPNGASDIGLFTLTVAPAAAASTQPTVTITDDTAGVATGVVNYALTFSDVVTDLAADDFTVSNGSISAISGSGKNYTVAVAPNANTEGNIGLTLKANAVVDAAANPNAASTANPQAIDTSCPAVTGFTPSGDTNTATTVVNYALTFSEVVTGLAADDFTVSNGSISAVAGSGKSYTVSVVPNANTEGNIGLTLKANAVVDAVANPNAASTAVPQAIDTVWPTVTGFTPSGTVNAASTLVNYALTFSEVVTGLAADDFTVTNGAISAISGSGKSYTVAVAPNSNTEGTIDLTLKAGAVTDAAGHLNAFATVSLQGVDTQPPTVISFLPNNSANGIQVADDLALVFSESIQRGSGNVILKNAAGLVVEIYDAASSNNLSIANSKLTINPSSDLAYGTGYKVELAAGAIKDMAGNNYTGGQSYDFMTRSGQQAGTSQSDLIAVSAGNSVIDGGAGLDTAMFGASASMFTLKVQSNGSIHVSGADGSHDLTNIERLQFSDRSLAFDLNGNAGMAVKLLGTVFGASSVSKNNYVGAILHILDSGVTYQDVMSVAISFAGAKTPQQVASLLWTNVVGVAPTADQTQIFVDAMGSGITAGQIGVIVAETALNQQNVNLIGLAQTGIEYI